MIHLSEASFNASYLKALQLAVSQVDNVESSRAGDVINLGQSFIEIPPFDPRLIFLNGRRLNASFAIVEAAWVLSGSNHLAPLLAELPRYTEYSDDGQTLRGAYGYRLLRFFGQDQIAAAIDALRANNNSRRVVLTMYAPGDISAESKDIPCNTTIYLKVRNGALELTVLNRSNDLFLGVPYNVFVFGVLQRYIAGRVGVEIGLQRHFSDSLHLYCKDIEAARDVVGSNSLSSVAVVSREFGWSYSQAIIDNLQDVVDRSFNNIRDEQLRNFLQCYSAEGRSGRGSSPSPVIPDILGFVGYQFTVGSKRSCGQVKQWEDMREKLKVGAMKEIFEELASQGADKIVDAVREIAAAKEGSYDEIRSRLDQKGGPITLRRPEDNAKALQSLLLCMVYSSIDPWIASSDVGAKYKENILDAARRLEIDPSAVYPISSILDEVLLVLEK